LPPQRNSRNGAHKISFLILILIYIFNHSKQ